MEPQLNVGMEHFLLANHEGELAHVTVACRYGDKCPGFSVNQKKLFQVSDLIFLRKAWVYPQELMVPA